MTALSLDEARRRLQTITEGERPFEAVASELLALGVEFLGVETGIVTRIDERHGFWETLASTDPPDGRFGVGTVLDLEQTYCRRILTQPEDLELRDASTEGWESDPAYQTHDLHCYWGTAISVGTIDGTVCFFSTEPRETPFTTEESLFAKLIGTTVESELRHHTGTAELARQTDFTTVLSRILRHNLRTDATIIRGQIELLAERLGEPTKHERVAIEKLDELVTLSEKVRQFESAVKDSFDPQLLELSSLIDGAITAGIPQTADASVVVNVGEEVLFTAHPSLELALRELLENAAIHTGEEPQITVSAESRPGEISITVSDNGPGFPTQERAVLTHGTEEPLSHGSGFGLWIANWIVHSHGGSIAVAEGTKTTVTLTLPQVATSTRHLLTQSDQQQLRAARDRFKTAFEEATDGLAIIDENNRVIEANTAVATLLDQSRETLLGRPLTGFITDLKGPTAPMPGEYNTIEISHKNGDAVLAEYTVTSEIIPGQKLLILRNVTERERRERLVRNLYEIVADSKLDFEAKVEALLATGQEALGTTYGSFSHVDGDSYRFEAIVGPTDAVDVGDVVPLEVTNCERVTTTEKTLVLGDIERDAPELVNRAGNVEWGLSCYLGAPVYQQGEVYGTFCFYDTEARSPSFSSWEVTLVDLMSQLVTYELERERREGLLRDQRRQLAVYNRFQSRIRSIALTAIESRNHEEIERRVCDQLVGDGSYSAAWIGQPEGGEVTPRAGTGLSDRSLAALGESTPEPANQALLDGAVAIMTGAEGDLHVDGAAAAAAVPLTYEGAVHGVLTVYAAESDAFDRPETAVLSQLGELLGHAIYAVEQRKALESETATVLELQLTEDHPLLSVATEETDIAFERWIPASDGQYRQFVTVKGLDEEQFETVIATLPSVTDCTLVSDHDEALFFELTRVPTDSIETLTSHGGRIVNATITDRQLQLTVELPPGADVRAVYDGFKAQFPSIDLLAQRTTAREGATWRTLHGVVIDQLTDTQRTTLETAYFAGYYETPRVASGEDVAASLDIATATFSQHIRTAEATLLAGIFGER